MRTVIIGGGKGCASLLTLATGTFLKELTLNVQCVVDIDRTAPGIVLAERLGILTCSDMAEALSN